MIPFIDDPRWDTSPRAIREMQDRQILENKLRDAIYKEGIPDWEPHECFECRTCKNKCW